jgi:uncharacterized protein
MLSRAVAIARRILEFPLTKLIVALVLCGALAVPPVVFGEPHFDWLVLESFMAIAALLALCVVVRFIERKPFVTTLIPIGQAPRELAIGFGLGAGLITAVIGVLAVCGWFRVTGLATSDLGTLLALVRSLALFFVVAVFEETVFRGIVLRFLEQLVGTWAALAISAVLFGLVHIGQPHASLIAAIAIALEAGILLGALYVVRSRTLWLPIGAHWAWNLFEGPVFGTRVSGTSSTVALLTSHTEGPPLATGGEFGPEAGLVALVVCLIVGLWYLRRAVRRDLMMPPIWRR